MLKWQTQNKNIGLIVPMQNEKNKIYIIYNRR